jgi:hypothetical protein
MTLAARLAALEQRRPPTGAPPVDAAQVDRALTAICATYAVDGPDALWSELAKNPKLRPDQLDMLVRFARNLVERARRGDALTDHQAAILGMARP